MTNGAIPGEVAAVEMAQNINAIRASGAIVRVEPDDFVEILRRSESPLVVRSEGGLLSRKYHYLTSYKGLTFYTRTQIPLQLSPRLEVINARKIWIPE